MEANIILSNLENLPGMDIENHFGLVSGTAINTISPAFNVFKRIADMFSNKSANLDKLFENTRKAALNKMIAEAKHLGANAIINIRTDVIKMEKYFCEVHIYGSAVKANQF
jgi:uncharacterized protein YbjQ (UPF0145 family)